MRGHVTLKIDQYDVSRDLILLDGVVNEDQKGNRGFCKAFTDGCAFPGCRGMSERQPSRRAGETITRIDGSERDSSRSPNRSLES